LPKYKSQFGKLRKLNFNHPSIICVQHIAYNRTIHPSCTWHPCFQHTDVFDHRKPEFYCRSKSGRTNPSGHSERLSSPSWKLFILLLHPPIMHLETCSYFYYDCLCRQSLI